MKKRKGYKRIALDLVNGELVETDVPGPKQFITRDELSAGEPLAGNELWMECASDNPSMDMFNREVNYLRYENTWLKEQMALHDHAQGKNLSALHRPQETIDKVLALDRKRRSEGVKPNAIIDEMMKLFGVTKSDYYRYRKNKS